jgi:hypothetical protein
MWVVVRVWEHVLGIRCEDGTKEGKGLGLREDFLGREGGRGLPERRGV